MGALWGWRQRVCSSLSFTVVLALSSCTDNQASERAVKNAAGNLPQTCFFFAHFHIKRSEIPGITSQAPHYMSTICAKIISSVTKGSWSNKLLLRKMTQQFWEGGGRTNNQSKETFDPIQKRSSWFTVLHCATC